MVQNFAVFADRSASVKIKTVKIAASLHISIVLCVRAPRKFLWKPSDAIPQNFAPVKISRYTVCEFYILSLIQSSVTLHSV